MKPPAPTHRGRLQKRGYDFLFAAAFFTLIAVFGPAAWAQAQPMHARVSFAAGQGMIKGPTDTEWSYATVNTLVLPGDTIWADQTGTMELEMEGGTFLRLADGTKAEIVTLPPSAAVRAWTGSFYVQRIARSRGDVVFETPVANVEVKAGTQVRIDILTNGATTVSVRWGEAAVRANGDEVVLRDGMRSYIDPGLLPSRPVPFNRDEEDAFDAWNRERARLLAVGEEVIPKHIPVETAPIGISDLAGYGEWVYVDNTPYWRVTYVTDFVPYRVGYWSYLPAYGYCWIANYPFGYVTSHYGRWTFRADYGWLWTWRDTWGPAWVASIRYGPNFVWCPLDPWDRPVYFGDDFFAIGSARFGIWASSYCPMNDFLFYGCPAVYPRPYNPFYFRHIPASEINVWNINVNFSDHDFYRRLYGDPGIDIRNYRPRRVIRGPETSERLHVAARDRVAQLETQAGRARFVPQEASERPDTRTAADRPDARRARIRETRVQPEAMTGVAERAETLAERAPDPRVREQAREIARDAKLTARGMPAAGEPPGGAAARSERDRARTAAQTGVTPIAPAAPGGVTQRTERGRERTAIPTGAAAATPRVEQRSEPAQVRTPVERTAPRFRAQRGEPGEASGTPSSQPSQVQRTMPKGPSVQTRPVEPRMVRPERTVPEARPETRVAAPRVSAPERTYQSKTDIQYMPAVRTTVPESYRAPASVSRPMLAAPSREITRSAPAPSVQPRSSMRMSSPSDFGNSRGFERRQAAPPVQALSPPQISRPDMGGGRSFSMPDRGSRSMSMGVRGRR